MDTISPCKWSDGNQKKEKVENAMKGCQRLPFLNLSGSLAVTAHDLDLVRRHRCLVVQFKVDIFNEKGPHFVAESVGIKMALGRTSVYQLALIAPATDVK